MATLTLSASTVGAADAAAPRSAAGTTYRVLSTVTTISQDPADRTSELQYVTPHARYRLSHSYEGNRLVDLVWQEDVPEGKCRLDNRVLINPPKDWLEKQTTFAPLPPPTFGIRSTAKQVVAAIRDGKARPEGLTKKYGQKVRQLTVATENDHRQSQLLWVNPATDRPVAETKTFALGHVPNPARTRTLTSHWENVSLHALTQIKDEPKVPAGYSAQHDHVYASRCHR